MLDTILCSILCAKVLLEQPKHETAPVEIRQTQESTPNNRDKDKTPNVRSNNTSRNTKIQTKTKNNPTNGSNTPNSTTTSNRSDVLSNHNPAVASIIRQHFGSEADSALELYFRESGLRPTAVNKSSGACGLVQALPCSKLPCTLQDAECQVKWGAKYIKNRYGTASNAVRWHDEHNWY